MRCLVGISTPSSYIPSTDWVVHSTSPKLGTAPTGCPIVYQYMMGCLRIYQYTPWHRSKAATCWSCNVDKRPRPAARPPTGAKGLGNIPITYQWTNSWQIAQPTDKEIFPGGKHIKQTLSFTSLRFK